MKATIKENLRLALGTLGMHKLRSALTIIGVVIGVTCVMAIGSILTGMARNVEQLLHQFGTETIFVSKWDQNVSFKPSTREERMRKEISWEDYTAVRDTCGSCRVAAIATWPNGIFNARYKDATVDNVSFEGDTPEFAESMNFEIAQGHYFTAAENAHRTNVCVIGSEIAKTFFPRGGAIDREIRVNSYTCRVIGVLGKFKKFALESDDSNDKTVQIPYDTMVALYPRVNRPHWMAVQAYKGQVSRALDEMRDILRRSRKVGYNQPDNFGIATTDSIIESFNQVTGAIAIVMVVISSIGLLVGGVGVMNIMLMSVTERTREIGVRKAIGARRTDIIVQFLLEACTLTGAGGVLGILLGAGISLAIQVLLPALPSVVPLWAVASGFLVSVSVGVFFGIWPAIKASRLDPVEALRYE
jgi:putative ABC transport system permease protein